MAGKHQKKPVDWDKLAREVEEEERKERMERDPLKALYEQAGEEARRAMMKSFIESNGTVLNMDWSKVGKKTIKPYKDKDEKGKDGSDGDSDSDA